jgi:hypothetical protein
MSALALNPVGNLVSLVSDIAARGEKIAQKSAPARSRRRVTETAAGRLYKPRFEHDPGQDFAPARRQKTTQN